jgi:hypothetical protein
MAVRSRFGCACLSILLWAACAHQSEGRLFRPGGGGGTSVAARAGEPDAGWVDSEGAYGGRGTDPPARTRPVPLVGLPEGRNIASLAPEDCLGLLERAAVTFESVPEDEAPTVAVPVYVRAPLLGVSFGPTNGDAERGMLDCRLAVALYAWAEVLAEHGIVKVEHYSTYRPGARVRGNGKSSGHAHALAIDAARFHTIDGRVLDVEADWAERQRGQSPCPPRDDDGPAGRVLRDVVCAAVERDLFQVVLTPHYDRAHENHVHLELVPDVTWSYVR